MIAISYMAFVPNYSGMPHLVSMSDILNHFLAFFSLSMLFYFAYQSLSSKTRIGLLLFFAVFIEVIQYFLPTRSAEIADVLVDACGLFIAFLIQHQIKRATTNQHSISL
jgi:VanZ family protein